VPGGGGFYANRAGRQTLDAPEMRNLLTVPSLTRPSGKRKVQGADLQTVKASYLYSDGVVPLHGSGEFRDSHASAEMMGTLWDLW